MTTQSDNFPSELTAESLLQSFVAASDEGAAEAFLGRLFADHVQPQVRKAVRLKLLSFDRSQDRQAEQQDICQEVAVQLLTRFREIRANAGLAPIGNVRSYVIAIVQNACYHRLRLKRPARWRFKNRVRYLLNHASQFRLWCDDSGQTICGLAAWPQSQTPFSEAAPPQRDLHAFSPKGTTSANSTASLVELIEEFLRWCARPVALDGVVGVLAEVCRVQEAQFVEDPYEPGASKPGASVSEWLRDPSPDPARRLEDKIYLERLWREVSELPLNQRHALLLNMRDGGNSEALILFTLTGTTTLRQIADVLQISFEDFVELWNKLPLDDNTIAERQGLTRQQVINLRKSARERLARRMQSWGGKNEKSAAPR